MLHAPLLLFVCQASKQEEQEAVVCVCVRLCCSGHFASCHAQTYNSMRLCVALHCKVNLTRPNDDKHTTHTHMTT